MAGEIGTAYIGVKFDPAALQQQLASAGSSVVPAGTKIGSKFGLAMKAGVAGAVVGTALIVGKELVDIGREFDDLADGIRLRTGKSGEDLDKLVDTVKRVGVTTPASLGDVAEAVGEVNKRLGLTGPNLDAVSTSIVDLSRLTGEDVTANAEAAAKAFKVWDVAAGDMAPTLDKVWRASQEAGTPVGKLLDMMKKFGPTMQALGFGFDDTLGLMSSLESAGVPTTNALMGIRRGLVNVAKKGGDPAKALQKTIDKIKAVKDPAKAAGIAAEFFGSRSGPDLAKAIRSGRFDVEKLTGAIKNGKETVQGAADDTDDFAEHWSQFKNILKVAVEPAASALFDLLTKGMKAVVDNAPEIIAFFEEEIGPAIEDVMAIVEELQPVFEHAFTIAVAVIEAAAGAIGDFLDVVRPTVEAISALLKGDFGEAWDKLKEAAGQAVEGFFNNLKRILRIDAIILGPLLGKAKKVGVRLKDAIVAGLKALPGALGRMLRTMGGAIARAAGWVWGKAKAIGRRILDGIINTVAGLPGKLLTAIKRSASAYGRAASWAFTQAKKIGRKIIDGVIALGQLERKALKWLKDKIGGAISSVVTWVYEEAKKIGKKIADGIKDGIGDLKGWFEDKARGWLGAINPANLIPGRNAASGTAQAQTTGVAARGEGGASGGLAGPVPFGSKLRDALSAGARPAMIEAAAAPVLVRVYIGDQELRGIVRAEVDTIDTATARVLLAGGGVR